MKIGILTHYYKSVNYGGNLQAYALCKALQALGHDAQQLQIVMPVQYPNLLLSPSSALKGKLKRAVKLPLKAIACTLLPSYRNKQQSRKQKLQALQAAFAHFNQELIPHSVEVYTAKNVHRSLGKYDVFITGSDQVWNPIWYFPPFFLAFVPAGVPKLSYAASIAQSTLPASVKSIYREHLKDYIGISVREENAVALLQDAAPRDVHCVLDPTFLLTRQDWELVAAPNHIDTPYVFCYFLGNDPNARRVATDYAKKHGLTLVTIPHAAGQIHNNDENFGDIRLADPSPEDFLSLISHAQYIFTDSFHASAFSLIYERQFVVFPRSDAQGMGSRLYSLTTMFDVPERFCDSPQKTALSHIEALPPIDYTLPRPKFQEARTCSLDFLKTNLEKAEKMLKQ